jgi:hypothetical protein
MEMRTVNCVLGSVFALVLATTPVHAGPGDHAWSRGWDVTGFADLDGGGATGAAGLFLGMVDFGGGIVNAANAFSGDVFVARYAPDGTYLWARTFTPTNQGVTVTACAAAPSGSVYVAGTILGGSMINFGGGNLGGAGEMWIVKFDELGNFLWSDTFGVGFVNSLDADQNLLAIGGEFPAIIDFGGGAIVSNGMADAFVALLGGGGAHHWSAGFGDASQQRTHDVSVDPTGNIAAAGEMQGTVDFGGGAIVGNASPDVFLASFDPAGLHAWSDAFPGPFGLPGDVEVSVARDLAGNTAITGGVAGPVNLGGGVLPFVGGLDVFVAMYDGAGAHQWSKGYGSMLDDVGLGIAFDAGAHILASGKFEMAVDFGSGVLTSNGASDLFVASWTPDADPLWSRSYGTANADDVCRVATDPTGRALLHGVADNFIDFGSGMMPNADFYLDRIEALASPVSAPPAASGGAAEVAAFPNPFRSSTEIRFAVPRPQAVDVTLHDVAGRRVRTLALRAATGTSGVTWDGRDDAGRELPAGLYFWRAAGEDVSASGRVARLR